MIKNYEKTINCICNEIKRVTDIAIIGLSGGADSTLVGILCKESLGKEKTIGLHLPFNDYDNSFFNARSKRIADKLGIGQMYIPIKDTVNSLNTTLSANFDKEMSLINKGNSRARIRMCLLYGIAHHLEMSSNQRVRVFNTCNLSETYIGYETKYGDGGGDFAPIGDLFKSEIYQLLDYFKEKGIITEDMIDRVPSAGLWEGQTDFNELLYSYDEMEPHIKYLKNIEFDSNTLFKHPITYYVAQKHMNNKHKHQAPPVVSLRDKFCD